MGWKQWLGAAAVGLGAMLAPGAAATEPDGFVEPVEVLHTLNGTNPGAFYGWAVSELGDVDGDSRTDLVVGEPFTATGTTWVYSGRTGDLLYVWTALRATSRAMRSPTPAIRTATACRTC